MIITDEIKQHCENTIGTKDPDKIHHHKTGFYIGYAIGASEVESLKAKKEIDRVQIHTLREALYGAIHQLRQYAHRDEDYRRSIEKYMKILEP